MKNGWSRFRRDISLQGSVYWRDLNFYAFGVKGKYCFLNSDWNYSLCNCTFNWLHIPKILQRQRLCLIETVRVVDAYFFAQLVIVEVLSLNDVLFFYVIN